jgi:hypothetical protein
MLLWLTNIDFAGGGAVVTAVPPKHEGMLINVGKFMD